jgi:hypothetical protein
MEVRLAITMEEQNTMEVHWVTKGTRVKTTALSEALARIATAQTTLVDHVPVLHEPQ